MDGAEGRGRGKRRAGERDQCLLVRELRGVRGVLGALALLRVDGERRAVLEQRLRLRLVAVELLEPRRARLHRPREVVGGEVLPALRLLVDDALLLQDGVELRLHLKNEAIIVTEGRVLPVRRMSYRHCAVSEKRARGREWRADALAPSAGSPPAACPARGSAPSA